MHPASMKDEAPVGDRTWQISPVVVLSPPDGTGFRELHVLSLKTENWPVTQ